MSRTSGLALLLALVAFAGCNRSKENSLETVLEMAGGNRWNLENNIGYCDINKNSVSRACRMVNDCIKDSLQPKLLLYLRDLTKGREDRILTYENGQQVWR